MSVDPEGGDENVLIYPGDGDEVSRLGTILASAGIPATPVASLDDLLATLSRAHALILVENLLTPSQADAIVARLDAEPDWSHLPVLLVPSAEPVVEEARLGTVTILAAAPDARALAASVRAAFATRQHQLICRRHIAEMADATDRLEKSSRRQRLLVRELHHRVKNTLATVQALMGSTARSSESVEEFRQALFGRIAALSHVHEILTEDKWQEASLRALFASELADHAASARIEGPDIKIPSHVAVPLGMAIHELTANALRYGALSEVGGSVKATWEIEASPDRKVLRIEWHEADGPPLPVPTRRGFGTQLLERVLRQQAAADVDIDYDPAGLGVVIRIPLPERTHFHLFAEA